MIDTRWMAVLQGWVGGWKRKIKRGMYLYRAMEKNGRLFFRWVQLSSPVDGGMGIRVGNS